MKNLFITLIICILGTSCTSGKVSTTQIPNSWRADSPSLPTDAENIKVAPTVDRMLGIGLSTLDAQANDQDKNNKWRLRGLMWNLGVSTKGFLGLLFGAGKAGFETLYTRTDEVAKTTDKLEATSVSTIDVSGTEKVAELPPQFEATIRDLVSKGKLKNEAHVRMELLSATERFHEMIRAVKSVPDSLNNFYLHGLQLEVAFDVEGKLIGPIGLGVVINFRLNWVRENSSTIADSVTDSPKTDFGKNMSVQLTQLIQNISYDLDSLVDSAAAENIDSAGYRLIQIKPYVAVSVGGDVGIATASTEWLMMLRFERRTNTFTNPSNFTLTNTDSIPVFVGDNGSNSSFIQAPRRQFARGLKRAMKIASFFARRAHEQSSSRWSLKEFSTFFEVTRGGSIGMMSVEGTPGIEITFGRTK